ncbi:2-keto-4-pentenoate hydratase/2-oxohepta-3-ene-1,7-dioic acid hydratase [Corynebacterium mustelae]|uniref:2-keto-4-pentenoate hydratase/2-oxohepta-3-ene-1,7-dioic acid hydratase n=1 Tax=Corynebacterium mustelae TaxID=571915 RepID=A0A0G3H0I4_9CORY|nr:fumarylacetoacetate hydrolase family protein [Corynebacterium mustelae]AKK05323.1 2-keto-4-pentenoate hydratase/2-oxohepta-3-ene-1,7-dioic acid hydratase [Corynebacterium mustelae]
MKIIRVLCNDGEIRFASLASDNAEILKARSWEELTENKELTGEVISMDDIRQVSVVNPSKVVAMACAFMPNPTEAFRPGIDRDPFFFLKPPSAIIGNGETIEVPPMAAGAVFESELAAVIGKTCKNVSAETALDYVVGYTICNDMSAPSVMQGDGQWSRGKGFDTFCPIGPVVSTDVVDPEDTLITANLKRGADVKQLVHESTAAQIWSVAESIAYCSTHMTLEPGDVISFGCPPGPIPVEDGDEVEVTIDGIGTLRNPVKQL